MPIITRNHRKVKAKKNLLTARGKTSRRDKKSNSKEGKRFIKKRFEDESIGSGQQELKDMEEGEGEGEESDKNEKGRRYDEGYENENDYTDKNDDNDEEKNEEDDGRERSDIGEEKSEEGGEEEDGEEMSDLDEEKYKSVNKNLKHVNLSGMFYF
jgi:adenylate kinase